ncbi:MAG: U32 family peptidase [Bacteroidales bacterium]
MGNLLELLAPAKDLQTGIAAITHGADAVYIAANKFGAREKAGNSIDDIKKLVNFAHQYNARVYVTVNTILFDEELDEAKKIIVDLYNANVDAIIIQDFSILAMDIPPIAVHASTQMHNNSPEKLKFLEECGIERIVLPRELSIEEIKEFRRSTISELEFFIHGALCVSYSGQCYLSQALTGRSANRGACAQPCRSAYDLIDSDGNILVKNKHLLSLKDLNLSKHIHELIDAGVSSFKIEGRMKDIIYVKNTVAYYNNLINTIIADKPEYRRLSSGRCEYSFVPDLERSFNRGFTEHFIQGRIKNQASYHSQKSIGKPIGNVSHTSKEYFTINSKETINNGDGLCYFTSKGELRGFLVNTTIHGKIYPNQPQDNLLPGTLIYRNADHAFEKLLRGNSSIRQISVSLKIEKKNNQLIFTATDEDLITAELIVEDSFENANNPELATRNLVNQLSKTRETVFKVDNIDIVEFRDAKHIHISKINAIRRELLKNLSESRLKSYKTNKIEQAQLHQKYPYPEIDYKGNISNSMSQNFLLSHNVTKVDKAYEISPPANDVELMVTRYCIKYELGLCPSKQNAKPTTQLFLRDSNFTFPLIFDCKNCQMKVMSPINTKNETKLHKHKK